MSGGHLAWLSCDGVTYWSRAPEVRHSEILHPELDSSVIRLISGVYERDPRWARRVIRNRIYTTEELAECSWGTVKVAARRVNFGEVAPPEFGVDAVEVAPAGASSPTTASGLTVPCPTSSGPLTQDEQLSDWVRQHLMGQRWKEAASLWAALDLLTQEAVKSVPRIVALPVSAVLLDAEGEVLSWGVNSAWDFRTQHAETNLIRRWHARGSPGVPAAIWMTRKPCKMCSGWIWDTWLRDDESRLKVVYRDPDDGPLARTTVLDAGTFENRRARARKGEISCISQH